MPSGQTHDRITLWSLPPVTAIALLSTHSSNLTLLVSGGFIFGGLMFGPDLDIHSRQFKRWGFLRWIWLPYQKRLRHRSFLSHGLIIGTTLRILYLISWIIILLIPILVILVKFGNMAVNWPDLTLKCGRSLVLHSGQFAALWMGLEAGAMSHSFSDWSYSAYKRIQKQGLSGWLNHGKMKKRQVGRTRRRVKKQ
jgi:uncharacterized metal-binding protein